jgi:hypothetical protein
MTKINPATAPLTPSSARYVAFQEGKRIAEGTEAELAQYLGQRAEDEDNILIFDLSTSEQLSRFYLASSPSTSPPIEPPAPTASPPPAGPGRPKLGVIAREITLLPHDWEWLSQQPGGASVTLRKLVLTARRFSEGADRVRQAKVVCYRFIMGIAGHEPGFEEATRALFKHDAARFTEITADWPADVRDHARRLAVAAFEGAATSLTANTANTAADTSDNAAECTPKAAP